MQKVDTMSGKKHRIRQQIGIIWWVLRIIKVLLLKYYLVKKLKLYSEKAQSDKHTTGFFSVMLYPSEQYLVSSISTL
jgi:hypothetical protein